MSNTLAIPVVTIDGPSGSGKGTIGLLLAEALGWHFLDSGALYRLLALAAIQQQADVTNEDQLEKLSDRLNIKFNSEIWLEGQPVTEAIRSQQCSDIASKIAVYPAVRAALLEKQRAFCQPPGLVADGRDMGTVVFPQAILKIFLEASVEERAKRRFFQLKEKGQSVTLQNLLVEIEARDARDKSRAIAPLIPAEDAVVIDTTALGTKEVVERVLQELSHRLR